MNKQLLSLRSLLTSIGSIQLATAALGTLVALQIAASGGSQEVASLVAASYSLGFLLGCFFIAGPLARVGHIRAFAASAALCTIFTLLLSRTDTAVALVLARFITGLATAGLFAIGDAWINDTAGAGMRGRILAIHAIVLGVASLAAQALVVLIADDLAGSFVLIAMLYCVAIVVLAMTRTNPPHMHAKASLRLRAVLRESPTAFVGALAAGAVTTVLLNVYPYRASAIGLSAPVVAGIVAALYAGRILFQYPLGKASDRMDRRIIVIGAALVTAGLIAFVASLGRGDGSFLAGESGTIKQVAGFAAIILLGGAILPLYSLLVAHAMDRTVPVFVASTAITLLFVWTAGGVVGPIIAAAVSEAFGDAATSWSLVIIIGAFAAFAAYRTYFRERPSAAESTILRPPPTTSIEMAPTAKR